MKNFIFCAVNLTNLELENTFASLKINENSGCDVISLMSFLAKGIFPVKLKIARVIPIFKKGNNTLATNYRPMSVLPCFSKLL